ncbi:hypothetical protein HDR62_03155 [bacterium]|nr:hypothetical protein [bacterium]
MAHTRIFAGAALLFLLLFMPEGAGAQRVYKSSLPPAVQESFRLAHPNLFPLKIVKWDWTSVGYCARYNFPYNEVMSLFQTNGEWVSTRRVIPEATLPLRAHDFISAKYAFYNLRSCTYEEDRWQGRHYYALFSIRGIPGYMTEVCFDMQGNVVSIDGTVDEDWDNFEPLNEEEVLLLQAHQSLPEEEVLSSVRGYEEREEDGDEVEEEEVAEPSIGFFAWREDYAAMKQKKKEEREQKTSAFEEKWLSFLAKLKIKVHTEEEEESAEQQQEDFQKEKDRQTHRLYRPQSRRDFSYAQVMVQSKTAQMKQASEDEEMFEETVEPVREDVEPIWEEVEPIEEVEEIIEPVEQPAEQLAESSAEPATPTPLVRTESMQSSLAAANVPSLTISAKTIFPDDIQETFDKRFPKAERVKYFRDTNTDYRAVFTNFGQKAEAVFLHDGTHITTALFFGKKEISYPIRQYIESQPNKPKFVTGKRVVYESRYRQRFTAAEKPQNYYEVVVWEKNKEKSRDYYLLRFDHKGHFISSTPYDYVGSR